MRTWMLTSLLLATMLGLSACGSAHVDTAKYTCANFNKSLNTKGDNSAGTFIRDLRAQAKLGQDRKTEEREMDFGIIFACRGKPASTAPGPRAIAIAKLIRD